MATPSEMLEVLLARYEKGESTPAERHWIEQWYENLSAGTPVSSDNEKALAAIWKSLQKSAKPKIRTIVMYRAAAAIIIVLAGIALLFQPNRADKKTEPRWMQMTAARREVKKIVLPDSSTVWLNAASSLRFDQNMLFDSVRRIYLTEGEAFFDIRQDPAHPFEVITATGIRTSVLGTSFDIKAYANDGRISVAVVTGKVNVDPNSTPQPVDKVSSSTKSAAEGILTAGQALSINTANPSVIDRYNTNFLAAGGWRTGQLEFDNATILEIANTLERWYKIPVVARITQTAQTTYAGSPAPTGVAQTTHAGPPAGAERTDRYNARFNKGASLDEVLRLLTGTNGLAYRKKNDSLFLFTR